MSISDETIDLQAVLDRAAPPGVSTAGTFQAIQAAQAWLDAHSQAELLGRVGQRIEGLGIAQPVGKSALQDSYGGDQPPPSDDLLAGRGLFYVTEQGRLVLDCTAGHYQMLWGYNDPLLVRQAAQAVEAGIVWDNHSNVPQAPVKLLAHRLLALANPPGSADPLDTVNLGCCTGSVACAAGLKIQLTCYERRSPQGPPPVIVVLRGNYHGTDMIAQRLREMWPQYVHNLHVAAIEPNDAEQLRTVFADFGPRVAGFWAEPVLMNREAINVSADYLRLARRLCNQAGALMCVDEIQTGFWQPEVFAVRALGVEPDIIICGKGMTAGFHPLAAVLFKSRHDVLAQYDAISTNGGASLAALMALCSLDRLQRDAQRVVAVGERFERGMHALAQRHPDLLLDARGWRHMMGLKFRHVADALALHRQAGEAGLWVRAHAYHEGHSTVLTKLALPADEAIVDHVLAGLDRLLGALRETAPALGANE